MIIKKTFRFRLRPNKKHWQLFRQFAGARRWVYNHGLNERKSFWEKSKKSITAYDQNKNITQLKKEEETAWLKDVHSQVLQQSLGDLDLAFQHFFRRVKKGEKPGYPRFQCRGEKDSFRYPQGVKVTGDFVYLPKIGWVRFRKSREIEGSVKQTTVILDGDKWYVCFSCEILQDVTPVKESNSVVGIDVGLENFAIFASQKGIEEVENPKYLRRELGHLRFLSRQLSKKTKRSSNWRKAKERLARFHAKVRNKRKDFLHKLSTKFVKNHDTLVVESLGVKDLLLKAPKALARAISDAGWRQFLQNLKYKCEYFGKIFLEAGKWFPSTKMCHQCGKENSMKLSDRWYSCSCGVGIHRDHNSALVLRAVGTTGKKACGAALV